MSHKTNAKAKYITDIYTRSSLRGEISTPCLSFLSICGNNPEFTKSIFMKYRAFCGDDDSRMEMVSEPPLNKAYFYCARGRVAPYLMLATAGREIMGFMIVRPVWLRGIQVAFIKCHKRPRRWLCYTINTTNMARRRQ